MIELPRIPSRGGDIPKELPVYRLEALSSQVQKVVHDTWLSLHIKHCEVCGRTTEEYKVKTCGHCGFTRVKRVFYCVSQTEGIAF
jgi:ribosomal protein L37E